MLLTDTQAALNDIVTGCRDAAERYRDAARIIGDDPLAETFCNIAARRNALAETLESEVRHTGILPQRPDPEREGIAELVTHVRAMLSADERLIVIEERQQSDNESAAAVDAVLRRDYPPGIKNSLERLRQEISEARRQLSAARGNLSGRGTE